MNAIVWDLTRDIFDALDTSDSTAEGGRGSQREAIEADLKQLDPAEVEAQLRSATRVLEGLVEASEGINFITMVVFSDALNRVQRAHRYAVALDRG